MCEELVILSFVEQRWNQGRLRGGIEGRYYATLPGGLGDVRVASDSMANDEELFLSQPSHFSMSASGGTLYKSYQNFAGPLRQVLKETKHGIKKKRYSANGNNFT